MLHGTRDWMTRFDGAVLKQSFPVIAGALTLLAVLTATMIATLQFVDVGTVTIFYLIAVLFAALRGGILPALITAIAAIGCAAFFFYPPIYDFRVSNPVHVVDLILFIIVAIVTGKLATDVREAKMREQSDALRDALIDSVSHELRTPLATIVGSASVLAQSPDIAHDVKLTALVQGLRKEADRLNELIQNLLDATRINTEGIKPRKDWVDPGDIVNSSMARKSALIAGHQFIVAVDENLPLVQTDPALVEKALGQLIENAAKYSPPGSMIAIAAEHHNKTVRISVKDQGEGLTAEDIARIWERFYRSPRHRENIVGSGLGLWIARALVLASGGTIDVFSAGVGRGATFSISLPITEAGSMHDEEADD